MVKCALALCHSNADVKRSLSVKKRMLAKQNMLMKGEIIIGLRATKAAVQHYDDIQNVPITLDMIKAVEKSYHCDSTDMAAITILPIAIFMQFIQFFLSIIHIYTLDFIILTLMLQIYMVLKVSIH